VQKRGGKIVTKSDSFDAFINAYAYVYKHLITRSTRNDDDDDDAQNDDYFPTVGKIVREYEAQSFITPTKECAEQKPNNDRKGGRERGQNRR
jgi:hypothetical protein